MRIGRREGKRPRRNNIDLRTAELRRDMNLKPGQTILWEKVSAKECRLIIEPHTVIKHPVRALNFAMEHGLPQRRSGEVLAELREGEEES